jgi:hypothetical protein
MAENLSLNTGAPQSLRKAYRFWRCCQCLQDGRTEIVTTLESEDCCNGHQRCSNCSIDPIETFGTQNAAAGEHDEYMIKDTSTTLRSLRRTSSYDSIFIDEQGTQHRPSISALVSWDDSALDDKYHIPLSTQEDQLQKGQHLGIVLRRMEKITSFDYPRSDKISRSSSPSSFLESDCGDEPSDKRFSHPEEYFQELDDLGSKIYARSSFKILVVSSPHLK